MRVATPLLYHVVVLRYKPQAQALEQAMKRNPDLGQYIKKLRLEGGFGMSVYKIIVASPNITDLCLTLELWSTDNVPGLVKGFPLMEPVNVILRESGHVGKKPPLENNCTRAFMETLCDCIEDWKTLKTFDFPYNHRHGDFQRGSYIAFSLSYSPSIETVYISHLLAHTAHLNMIARNSNLKQIRVKAPPKRPKNWPYQTNNKEDLTADDMLNALDTVLNSGDAELMEIEELKMAVMEDERLRSIVVFDEEKQDPAPEIPDILTLPPPSNPAYVPMQNASNEVKEKIWSRVIYFASGTEPPIKKMGWFAMIGGELRDLFRMRMNIACVSKRFWHLTEPYLYRNLIFESYKSLIAFCILLESKPSLAPHIHTLSFRSMNSDEYYDSDSDYYDPHLESMNYHEHMVAFHALSNILGQTSNLVALRQISSPLDDEYDCRLLWEVLEAIPDETAGKMEEVVGLKTQASQDEWGFCDIRRFRGLRELRVNCGLRELKEEEGEVDAHAMPGRVGDVVLEKLETFAYAEDYDDTPWWAVNDDWFRSKTLSLIGVMAAMQLRSLRKLDICSTICARGGVIDFLTAHGSKLEELKMSDTYPGLSPFKFCENLKVFSLSWDVPPEAIYFLSERKVPLLERITINGNIQMFGAYTEMWDNFFDEVDFTAFPALKELCIPACQWPTTEREIKDNKNPWLGRSEMLSLRCGVKLVDGEGRGWVPRLGMNGQKRRKRVRMSDD